MRSAFMPGGPKAFGVFNLTIVRGSCATARRVARAWARSYNEILAAGGDHALRSVAGFAFTTLAAKRLQELRQRGRKRTKSMRFDYRVPNG